MPLENFNKRHRKRAISMNRDRYCLMITILVIQKITRNQEQSKSHWKNPSVNMSTEKERKIVECKGKIILIINDDFWNIDMEGDNRHFENEDTWIDLEGVNKDTENGHYLGYDYNDPKNEQEVDKENENKSIYQENLTKETMVCVA